MFLSRPNWDEYFLGIAEAVSLRSDCRRAKVGAVLVDRPSRRILATGYVGVAAGEPGCLDGTCPRGLKSFSEVPPYSDYSDCISIHAEQNCIDYAVRWYGETYDFGESMMYVTRRPCHQCISYGLLFDVKTFVYLDKVIRFESHPDS